MAHQSPVHEYANLEMVILNAARRIIELEEPMGKYLIRSATHSRLAWAHGILASYHQNRNLSEAARGI